MENTKKPAIRFKGFTEAWEQRKVSDVAEICAGGTPSTSIERYWYPKEIPWLSSGEVHKKYISFTDNEISTEGMNNSSARIIPENSVLIALAGQGKTRGTVAINRIPLTTNQSIAAMSFSARIVPEFVFCNLESRYDEIRRMSSGDGSRGGLNKQIVGDIEIPYTSADEQRKIGAFFTNLDDLITLHQRKCDKLVNVKKSMLEKMFPKNGCSVPEIRFKGFTEAWEQRKLGEVVDVRSGKDYKHLQKGSIPVYGTGGYMLSVNEALSYSEDAIGIGRKGTIDKPYILKAPFWTVDTLFYAVPRERYNLNFVFDIFQNIDWKKKDESTGVPSLSKNAINEIEIFTSDETEQKALGNYFAHIDNLITLHQRELEKLKNIKKSMLEKMFI